ncbi:MAG: NAD-dependent epimerase/dehydratase family protein [Erythrobacter sp.]
MTRSVAIVGAGQIGFAAAFAFHDRGWDPTIYARSEPEWLDRMPFRFKPYVAGTDPAPEADIVVDTIAFDEDDVARYDPERIARLIAISSCSVYRDDEGRTLDEAQTNGWPEFDGIIDESQPTVAPGPETYSTRKIRMERKATELFGERATILRPCAVYGEHSRHPREWWFIKRLLDRRAHIPLMLEGRSRFQTTDADDIGYGAVTLAEGDLGGVYNVADEDSPSVLEIGEVLSRGFDHPSQLVPIDADGLVGRTPWSVAKPITVCAKKLVDSGLDTQSTYASGAPDAAAWLADLNPADWRAAFPQLAAYPWDLFDYEAEDRFLASL